MGENKVIYEYLTILTDWFGGLEKGTRLYYSYKENGYVYHTDSESTTKDEYYQRWSSSSTDYFISLDLADQHIKNGKMAIGPALGELIAEGKSPIGIDDSQKDLHIKGE